MLIKTIKIMSVVIFLLSLLVLAGTTIVVAKYGINLVLVPILYWLLFISWVCMVGIFRWGEEISFRTGLGFFVIGALLLILTLESEIKAEFFMKAGFIFFLVGLFQTIVKHKKNEI